MSARGLLMVVGLLSTASSASAEDFKDRKPLLETVPERLCAHEMRTVATYEQFQQQTTHEGLYNAAVKRRDRCFEEAARRLAERRATLNERTDSYVESIPEQFRIPEEAARIAKLHEEHASETGEAKQPRPTAAAQPGEAPPPKINSATATAPRSDQDRRRALADAKHDEIGVVDVDANSNDTDPQRICRLATRDVDLESRHQAERPEEFAKAQERLTKCRAAADRRKALRLEVVATRPIDELLAIPEEYLLREELERVKKAKATEQRRRAAARADSKKVAAEIAAVEQAQWAQRANQGLTMAAYKDLDTGLSYDDVVHIIGRDGVEQSRSAVGNIETAVYAWRSEAGGSLLVTFQNDRLVLKAQHGLR